MLTVLLVGALVALPLIRDGETMELGKSAYAQAEGEFIQGPAGTIHYQVEGPEDGKPLLLIHGVSGPMCVWDKNMGPLTSAGFKVIRFDLYGRGFSDRPDTTYNLALYREQALALLESVGVQKPVTLVGSSMGCLVAADLAVAKPALFDTVVLIGPAGFPLQASPVASAMKVPYLSTYLMKVVGDEQLKSHNHRYFHRPQDFESYHEDFRQQMKYKGYKRAILSTMQNVPVKDFEKGYRKLGELDQRILLIWGKQDRTFPYHHHEAAIEYLSPEEFVAVDSAGHLPQYEQAENVNAEIIDFLTETTQ